ncbi:MAG: TIGR02147 family protein [Bacteriovoracaceae bacterium]|jgi:uncharacterized protein (TIGR02147 family)|nr:TIGR02147 family protein [Bacteriovoracaceae bacterium]
MKIDIYNYRSARHFLVDYCRIKKSQGTFSVRKWSKTMGFKSHSTLHEMLRSEKPIKPSNYFPLTRGLEIDDKAKRYLGLLIQYENAKSDEEKRLIEKSFIDIKPEESSTVVSADQFDIISEWHHMAILEMTKIDSEKFTKKRIIEKLNGMIGPSEVERSIEGLVLLGLLSKTQNDCGNTHYKASNNRVATPKDISAKSIRFHHIQVLEKAKLALETQSKDQRLSSSCAMAIDSSKLSQAREVISEFRSKMHSLMSSGHSKDKTYQLSVQFFDLLPGVSHDHL